MADIIRRMSTDNSTARHEQLSSSVAQLRAIGEEVDIVQDYLESLVDLKQLLSSVPLGDSVDETRGLSVAEQQHLRAAEDAVHAQRFRLLAKLEKDAAHQKLREAKRRQSAVQQAAQERKSIVAEEERRKSVVAEQERRESSTAAPAEEKQVKQVVGEWLIGMENKLRSRFLGESSTS